MCKPNITIQTIFKNLAAGQFRPMSADDRECFAGGSANAVTMMVPTDKGDLYIIADCAPGEGLHLEVVDEEGSSWGVNPSTGAIDLLNCIDDRDFSRSGRGN